MSKKHRRKMTGAKSGKHTGSNLREVVENADVTDNIRSIQETVDYGETADAYANSDDGEEENVNDLHEEGISDNDDAVDEEDASSSHEEDESDDDEEEDVAAALFQDGSTSNEVRRKEEEDVESDDETGNSSPNEQSNSGTTLVKAPSQPYTFDLRNLLGVSTDQLAISSLYTVKESKTTNEANILIPLENAGLTVDEDFLLKNATNGCSQLIQALWQLPTEQSDAGPLATLPSYEEIRLPRALPPPPPKQATKWEKFAKAKGIPLNKEKRSRKVFDEATQTWMYRHGYEKANKSDKEWPIMEVGPNDDPYADPWEKLREEKSEKVGKNIASRMKNAERAGNLTKGATNRVMKGREKAYKAGKEGGRKDQDSLPIGVPVDLKNGNNAAEGALRGKSSTVAALTAVQRSTASLGKFDRMREGEPERKKTLSKMKKRKYESSTDKKVILSEGEKSMKILKTVVTGGAQKEKAIRKGHLAKGETAYDYDYDDGLGASSFRKKKGRAGAGKMKKMTKKRAKVKQNTEYV